MSYRIYEAGACQYCGIPLGTLEVNGGRDRQYCSNAHRQAAYRERKRNKAMLPNGKPRQTIEREEAQGLHLLSCICGRGIWTVRGNVQIGGLRCDLCDSEFTVPASTLSQ